jgi:predicted transport protein
MCPKCNRRFTRRSQRHACGTGEGEDVLRNRPATLVSLYDSMVTFVKAFGQVELVTRDRYVLMRSTKIFADLVVMSSALRLAIHLPREVPAPIFIKVVTGRRHITHVAKIQSEADFNNLKSLLREAYDFSVA